jgi:acetyl esterase/lipase
VRLVGRIAVLLVIALAGCGEPPTVMSAGDALALPQPEPDHRVAYGSDPLQFGELRLPAGPGPHPVAVVIHGGCWLSEYDLGYMSAFADALTRRGVATWSIEYRRVGDEGGGFPGTFLDVAAAVDHLPALAAEHRLDLERVVAVGHSAGGHLALWLAGRHRLAPEDELRGSSPQKIHGVVALAGIPDLAGYAAPEGCGAAVPQLVGGDPADHPDRVGRISPIEQVPLGVPQILVVGAHDGIVPRSQADDHRAAAGARGDDVVIVEAGAAGHFELIVPDSEAWPPVRDAVLSFLMDDAPRAASVHTD